MVIVACVDGANAGCAGDSLVIAAAAGWTLCVTSGVGGSSRVASGVIWTPLIASGVVISLGAATGVVSATLGSTVGRLIVVVVDVDIVADGAVVIAASILTALITAAPSLSNGTDGW